MLSSKFDELVMTENVKSDIDLVCSFCDKKSYEVKKIFKGEYATICDECVELCAEIIEEETEERMKLGTMNVGANPSSDLVCAFCTRHHLHPEVFLLIAGPGKYISDKCTIVCICDKCTIVFMDELKFI
jgi:hypothetical protein